MFVIAVELYQLFVSTRFYDFAIVHDTDEVGIFDSRQAVRDDQCRAVFHQVFESFLHQAFRFGVEGRCRFVEDKDRRVFEYGAGDAYALALPSRETATPVADRSVVPVFRSHDEVVCIGYAGGFFDLFFCGVGNTECDIVVEGIVEKNGFLTFPIIDRRSNTFMSLISMPSMYIPPLFTS